MTHTHHSALTCFSGNGFSRNQRAFLLRLTSLLLGSLLLSARAHADTVTQTFTYTGSNQSFVVPKGVTYLFVRLWGAGGASRRNGLIGDNGGGGAFVSGSLAVTPGSVLTLVVGGGGNLINTSVGGPNGGFGGGGNASAFYSSLGWGLGGPSMGEYVGGGGGGGRSAILQNGEVVDAGGGGGGGGSVDNSSRSGGAGGLATGQSASTSGGGGGGTQTSGGNSGGGAFLGGSEGSAWQGGNGGPLQGGGGGGGYYGGGGGYTNTSGPGNILDCGGGGGGSSLTSHLSGFAGAAGSNTTPGGTSDPFYLAGVGAGGGDNQPGGNGEIVLSYERPLGLAWQAGSLAAAPDGTTRLVCNRADGLCNLWSVDASGQVVQSFDYGPFPGWSAAAVSVGGDNNTRILWRNQDGRVDIWSVDTAQGSGQVLSSTHLGPYADWTAAALSTGADNHTRLLWRYQDGRIDLWNLDTGVGTDAATLLSDTHFGPFAGWTATSLSVGSDNNTRLLWNYQDGTANVWNLDTGTSLDAATLLSTVHYGPYVGWTATGLSVGGDNNLRLLWNNVDGTVNLWNLAVGTGVDNSTLLASTNYGPFPDFTLGGLSVGADNTAHLLWNRTDGLLDLWSVDVNGGFLSSFHFGPF